MFEVNIKDYPLSSVTLVDVWDDVITSVTYTDGIVPNNFYDNLDKTELTNIEYVKGVVITEGITSIGDSAFEFINSNFKYVIIDSSKISYIGASAFKSSYLTDITFNKNFDNCVIAETAFMDIDAKTLIIPEGVIEIKWNAFSGNKSLTDITLPSTLKKISPSALACKNLTGITVNAIEAPELDDTSFSGIQVSGTLTYPEGSDYSKWISVEEGRLGSYGWNGSDYYIFKVNKGGVWYASYNNGTNIFTITTLKNDRYINCEVKEKDDWIYVSSYDSWKWFVRLTDNTTGGQRTGKVVFIQNESGNELEINIIQSGEVLDSDYEVKVIYCGYPFVSNWKDNGGVYKGTNITDELREKYYITETFSNHREVTALYVGSKITSLTSNSFQDCSDLNTIYCYGETAPSIDWTVFNRVATGGTLYYPEGSDYSKWLSTKEGFLGYQKWNDIDPNANTYVFKVKNLEPTIGDNEYEYTLVDGKENETFEIESTYLSGEFVNWNIINLNTDGWDSPAPETSKTDTTVTINANRNTSGSIKYATLTLQQQHSDKIIVIHLTQEIYVPIINYVFTANKKNGVVELPNFEWNDTGITVPIVSTKNNVYTPWYVQENDGEWWDVNVSTDKKSLTIIPQENLKDIRSAYIVITQDETEEDIYIKFSQNYKKTYIETDDANLTGPTIKVTFNNGDIKYYTFTDGIVDVWWAYNLEEYKKENIISVVFGEGIKAIDRAAFYGCTNLVYVALNEGLEEIGIDTFTSCKFSSITIPSTVRQIGGFAFSNCKNLKQIIVKPTLYDGNGNKTVPDIDRSSTTSTTGVPAACRTFNGLSEGGELVVENCEWYDAYANGIWCESNGSDCHTGLVGDLNWTVTCRNNRYKLLSDGYVTDTVRYDVEKYTISYKYYDYLEMREFEDTKEIELALLSTSGHFIINNTNNELDIFYNITRKTAPSITGGKSFYITDEDQTPYSLNLEKQVTRSGDILVVGNPFYYTLKENTLPEGVVSLNNSTITIQRAHKEGSVSVDVGIKDYNGIVYTSTTFNFNITCVHKTDYELVPDSVDYKDIVQYDEKNLTIYFKEKNVYSGTENDNQKVVSIPPDNGFINLYGEVVNYSVERHPTPTISGGNTYNLLASDTTSYKLTDFIDTTGVYTSVTYNIDTIETTLYSDDYTFSNGTFKLGNVESGGKVVIRAIIKDYNGNVPESEYTTNTSVTFTFNISQPTYVFTANGYDKDFTLPAFEWTGGKKSVSVVSTKDGEYIDWTVQEDDNEWLKITYSEDKHEMYIETYENRNDKNEGYIVIGQDGSEKDIKIYLSQDFKQVATITGGKTFNLKDNNTTPYDLSSLLVIKGEDTALTYSIVESDLNTGEYTFVKNVFTLNYTDTTYFEGYKRLKITYTLTQNGEVVGSTDFLFSIECSHEKDTYDYDDGDDYPPLSADPYTVRIIDGFGNENIFEFPDGVVPCSYFKGYYDARLVAIGQNITTLSPLSFSEMTNVVSVTMYSVTNIQKCAFAGDYNLKRLYLRMSSCPTFHYSAFAGVGGEGIVYCNNSYINNIQNILSISKVGYSGVDEYIPWSYALGNNLWRCIGADIANWDYQNILNATVIREVKFNNGHRIKDYYPKNTVPSKNYDTGYLSYFDYDKGYNREIYNNFINATITAI